MTKNIKNKKLIIILGTSIILNALFAGIMIGKQTHKMRRDTPPRPEFKLLTKQESEQHRAVIDTAKKELENVFLQKEYDRSKGMVALEEFDIKLKPLKIFMYNKIAIKAEKLAPKERIRLLRHADRKAAPKHRRGDKLRNERPGQDGAPRVDEFKPERPRHSDELRQKGPKQGGEFRSERPRHSDNFRPEEPRPEPRT